MTSTLLRRPTAPHLAVASIAAFAVALAPFATTTAAHSVGLEDPIRLDTGHVDVFHVGVAGDGAIYLNVGEDVTGHHVERTAESVELFVKKQAYLEGLPPAYLPPGAPTSLWYLPLTQDPDLIWPGWDSQSVSATYGADADVDIVVSQVEGPGDVYLWSQGPFGDPTQLLADDWALPDTIRQSIPSHTHANWGFTAPGTYTMTAQATVTSQDGARTSTSNAAEYTFVVEPLVEAPATEIAISGVPAHYHTGEVATLTAVQSPTPVSNHYHWFTRATSADEWTVVPDAASESYGFIVTDEQQVKVAIYDHDHNVIAESAPVDIHVDDHGNTPGVGPELNVSLPEEQGALVVSVAAGAETAELSDLALNATADRYVSEGIITGITVTDTRSGDLGWSASGRVRGLTTIDGSALDGSYVGWTPAVRSASAGQSVIAGGPVTSSLTAGTGIKAWKQLGSASAGSSRGTAVLGADIRIEAPTTTRTGDYTGVVLITVI